MTLRCCRRSSTASSPAHRASADLPVPARPPSETMPISSSSSRSIAIRCSALRPCSPNTSWSPRTSCTCLSAVTRPSAEPRGQCRTTPVWQSSRSGLVPRRVGVNPLAIRQATVSCSHRCRHLLLGQVERVHAGPAGVDGQLGAVLLGAQPDGRRLDPHRQVLGHDGDVVPLGREVRRDGEDPGVVVAQAEAGRQHRGSVWLSSTRSVPPPHRAASARRAGRARCAGRRACAGRAGEVAELGVVPLGLQLRDDHDREDHVVLREPQDRPRVGEEHRGVEHVRSFGRQRRRSRPTRGSCCALLTTAGSLRR